ncbi:MAG: formate/nitrite transporter family protein [Myxococcales bacterium]
MPEQDRKDALVEDEEKRKKEEAEAEERSAPNPSVVWDAVHQEGCDELRRRPVALMWSGLAAGLSMGFSLISEGLLRAHLPDAGWRPLVSKLGYSVGFLVVVLGRQQLFTENTLTVVLPVLHDHTRGNLRKMMRLWAIVLSSNLAGALAIGWTLGHTAVFDRDLQDVFRQVAQEGLGAPFGTVLLRGVFAGWTIALMVWLMPAAETARIWVVILLTYVIALGGFAHVVAGSVDKLFLVTTGHMSVGDYLGGFLAPSLFGNVIGGVSLVAALNHVAAAPTVQRS